MLGSSAGSPSGGDIQGYILAWSSLLPVFIFISISTLVLFRRDLHTICFGAGILLNELINKALKNAIKEPRPDVPDRAALHSYGNPSDHSQYMAFFCTYVILFLYVRARMNGIWKILVGCLVLTGSALCCYSRVHLKYHTDTQVYWGVVAGALCGCIWFHLVHYILTPLFPTIVSWKISEFLMIRDYTPIPNSLWFDYCNVRTETRERMKKPNLKSS